MAGEKKAAAMGCGGLAGLSIRAGSRVRFLPVSLVRSPIVVGRRRRLVRRRPGVYVLPGWRGRWGCVRRWGFVPGVRLGPRLRAFHRRGALSGTSWRRGLLIRRGTLAGTRWRGGLLIRRR